MKLPRPLRAWGPFRRIPGGRKGPAQAPWLSRERLERPATLLALLVVLFSLLLALLVTPDLPFPTKIPEVGEVAPQDLKSPGDFLIEDVAATGQKRDVAEDGVRAVYDLDSSVIGQLDVRLARAFALVRPDPGAALSPETPEGREAQKRFQEALGASLPSDSLAALTARGFSAADEEALRALLRRAMAARVVSNRELLQDEARKGITVREVRTREEKVVSDLSSIEDLDQVRRRIGAQPGGASGVALSGGQRRLLPIARALVRPNLTFNRNETEERKTAARENVKPVTIVLKKGEIIARDGDPIRARHVMILEAIRKESLGKSVGSVFAGAALFLLLAMVSVYRFARDGVRKFKGDMRSALFLLGMLLLMAVLTRVLLFVADAVGSAFPLIPAAAYRYAIPVASGTMLVRMLLNSETAVFFAAILSLVAGLLVERSLFFTAFTFLGSIVGAAGVGQVQSRSKILQAGAKVGLLNVVLVALWGLMDGRLLAQETLVGVIAGFSGGLGAAIVVTALTPLAETLLGRITGLKLLELATHDQPLMRELALRAPGTYHHSMIMASLVESAAQSIQANPLLARVSAYYHDIGKMLKPHYFVENMPPGENRHDKLSPAMSSRVLKAHVKDGIELAKEHGLPQVLINAIPQHHGTSLIKFFYEKALESHGPGTAEVQEQDYRYPGPKPQSRECALLMLADSVEAAGRVLSDPNRTRVQGAVQKIINNIFRDGQLDECDLTLRDLNKIARSFTDTLTAIYHGRIAYPEPVAKGETPRKKKGDEGPADQPAEPGQDRPKRSGETPKDDLKRLGMS
jgi:putative nucleotidyltransferase with HDIG domain